MMEYFKLIKARKNAEKGLKGDYASDFTVVKAYLNESMHLVTFKEREEILNEILDMFLMAQEENKDVYEMFGGNYKSFCDSIVREYCGNSMIISVLRSFFTYGFILLTASLSLEFLYNSIVRKGLNTYATINNFVMITIITSLVVINYFITSNKKRVLLMVSMLILKDIIAWRYKRAFGYNILDTKVYLANFWPYFIVIILITTVLIYIRNNKGNKESMRNI